MLSAQKVGDIKVSGRLFSAEKTEANMDSGYRSDVATNGSSADYHHVDRETRE